MDNASVHTGEIAQAALTEFLEATGVTLVLLPTYSPELNPCEFVFSQIKHFVRSPLALLFEEETGREMVRSFEELITAATEKISWESLAKTYQHCSKLDPDSHVASILQHQGLMD